MWAAAGSILMFLAVALGAFGAHGLKNKLTPEMLTVYETGIKYHVYHALGLFIVAWLSEKSLSALVPAAGWLFLIGILLFSGSLYALSITGIRWLGAITPLGGLAFLMGWGFLAASIIIRRGIGS